MIDVKAVGMVVGGVATSVGWMYAQFTPYREFDQHVAQDRTRTVLDLIDVLQRTPPSDVTHRTLCDSLTEQIALICRDSDEHPFCRDRGMLLTKAGC